MSVKLVQQKIQNMEVVDIDRVIDEKLPIILNGAEKFATGLTKRTTVEDIIFAMLSVSDASFKPEHLADYGIVEKWQGNERILDGKIKIYKLIRLWKSLPGNQLQQVKFIIKKRAMKVSTKSTNESKNQFAHCTMSPALVKGWNVEKSQRRSTFAQRQLEMAASENTFVTVYSSDESSDVDSDLNSDEADLERNKLTDHKRFASIKRFNRSRNSSVRQIKKSFIDLVTKQNEIIDKQLNQIQETRSKSKTIKSKKSSVDVSEEDVKATFSCKDDNEAREYSMLCKNYFKIQSCLNSKVQRIEGLKSELEVIKRSAPVSATEMKAQEKVARISKKLLAKTEVTNGQNEKLNEMSVALSKVDDVITLKEKFIQSLELELQQLDSTPKKSLATTSESARSSTSSTSSVLTSISSVSNSQYANANGMAQKKFSYGDNESDTGISSANSEEFNSHLETLV